MDDMTFKILNLSVSLVFLVIARFVVPYLRSMISAEQIETITQYAALAVYAAEQILKENTGAEKKTYVVNLIDEFCDSHHFKITSDQINTLIESAVKEMHDVKAD